MIKPNDYKQGDSKWGSLPYAVDGETSTIKSAGCGPTAMADVLAAVVSEYIDPITCAAWARQHGFKVYKSGTSYNFPAAIGKEYGLVVERMNVSTIYGNTKSNYHEIAKKHLQNGHWLIACMGPGNWTKSGHYVVAYNYDEKDQTVDIMDPASSAAGRTHNKWSLFSSQVKYYWSVYLPERFKTTGIRMTDDAYRQEDYVREVQMCCRAGLDGVAGNQTLSKTITVSSTKNRNHPVVIPLQKYLQKNTGLYNGKIDGVAGPKFDAAMKEYQRSVVKLSKPDGEATAKGKTWRCLLGIK